MIDSAPHTPGTGAVLFNAPPSALPNCKALLAATSAHLSGVYWLKADDGTLYLAAARNSRSPRRTTSRTSSTGATDCLTPRQSSGCF